jgi:three-Cys-motif partner protein
MAKQRESDAQGAFPWASPTGPTGRKVPARLRLVRDRPQTQIKLAAYQAYLPEWLRILGQSPGVRHLFVLDLFAGPGEYRDGVAGSPVIAADSALVVQSSLQAHGRPVAVHLRLVEKDEATRALLRRAMARYDGRVDYSILDGTADERGPELLKESRGSPTLALLDPDGIDVSYELIHQFGGRRRTEVLLSFDVQALLRCAEIDEGRAVSRFFGDATSWRACYGPTGELDVVALLELYRLTLAQDRGFPYTAVHRPNHSLLRRRRLAINRTETGPGLIASMPLKMRPATRTQLPKTEWSS